MLVHPAQGYTSELRSAVHIYTPGGRGGGGGGGEQRHCDSKVSCPRTQRSFPNSKPKSFIADGDF